MKLAARILVAVLIILGTAFYYLTQDVLKRVRIRYLEGVEESLVDQARVLSSFISLDMAENRFSAEALHKRFDHVYRMEFSSRIYHLNKKSVDLRVYITDAAGIVIFDSKRRVVPGTDFSKWRDVYLTLRGRYGARSSRDDPRFEQSAVLYVAAPIIVDDNIAGVVTVAKPTTNINNFIWAAKKQIIRKSVIITSVVVLLSVLAIAFITRPIKRLTAYAHRIREGRKANLPRLDSTEIGDMGRAFESMRKALENRQYVEHYVQTLTHEIKSPVSAIRGAAELLEEEMPVQQRQRFIENIKTESERIKMLVDRLLELSGLENMTTLKKTEKVLFNDLLNEVIEWMTPLLSNRQIVLEKNLDPAATVKAEPFLLKQALSNLLKNSADFCEPQKKIFITSAVQGRHLAVEIVDQGPGLPEFAQNRVFEKFFSLQRPHSKKKSTGLGLNFVKEIAELHHGSITLENHPDHGACATLMLPLDQT